MSIFLNSFTRFFTFIVSISLSLSPVFATLQDEINIANAQNMLDNTGISNFVTNGKLLNTFSEEELIKIIDRAITDYSSQLTSKNFNILGKAKSSLISALREYHVTGFSLALDPNIAFMFDTQNPAFKVHYKNGHGQVKSRWYQAQIHSFGFKFQLGINLNVIFFTDTDFNFYDSGKIIELGYGIDLGVPFFTPFSGLHMTWTPFENAPGSMFMLGFPLFSIESPTVSIVTGGILIPKIN